MDKNILDLYFSEITKTPLLSAEEEVEIALSAQNGDEKAEEKLIRSNLRFVVSVAKEFQGRGVPLIDLINEGNLGLMRAVHKFDPTRGYRFITYAVWWIRQSIRDAMDSQARVVRLPLSMINVIGQVQKERKRLLQELSREPNGMEIAESLHLTERAVKDSLRLTDKHLSLDKQISTDENVTLLQMIADSDKTPERKLMDSTAKIEIDKALNRLPKRDSDIVRLYYGIGVDQVMTLEEIGKKFNLTRERVRQIKARAILRLRGLISSQTLRSIMNNS